MKVERPKKSEAIPTCTDNPPHLFIESDGSHLAFFALCGVIACQADGNVGRGVWPLGVRAEMTSRKDTRVR